MRCLGYREQLSAFIDDELDPQEMRVLNAHLKGCRRCRQELESWRSVQMLLREGAFAIPAPKPSMSFSERVMQAIAEDDAPAPRQAARAWLAESPGEPLWAAAVSRLRAWLSIPRYAFSVASLALVVGVLSVLIARGGVPFAANWFGADGPTLTTVYDLPKHASLEVTPRETDLEEALQEFAYHSSSEPTMESGAWVALAQVRYADVSN